MNLNKKIRNFGQSDLMLGEMLDQFDQDVIIFCCSVPQEHVELVVVVQFMLEVH